MCQGNAWAGRLMRSVWGPLIVTLALGLPRLRFPIGIDAAVFSNGARVVLDGGVLYRDTWFHAFPINPLVYAGLASIFGLNMALAHLVHLMESMIGVALIYTAGRLFWGRRHGLAAA
ncbi:MAG: hypothetical protein Q8R28_16650 [Dehalococcoidia bacterium]|nr:hypothetical protein [Dehalococcoidia bacterium]